MREEYRQLSDDPPYIVHTTLWQGKVRTECLPLMEARVMYEPLLRRAVIYFPNGRSTRVGETAWITARVRAEQARQAGEAVHRFPPPLLPAVETILRREARQGRYLPPDEWTAMFMLFSEESERLWAQFHCDNYGFVRRVASRVTEDITWAAMEGKITCSSVGVACYTTETDELLPWLGVEPKRVGRKAEDEEREGKDLFRSPKSEPEDRKEAKREASPLSRDGRGSGGMVSPREVKEERQSGLGKGDTVGLSKAALQFFQTS